MSIVGGVGSVGLTVWAGRRNPSWLLIALFMLWVALPFVGVAWAAVTSRRWPKRMQATLCAVSFIVAACSLLIYGHDALTTAIRTRAFVFLVVPPASAAVGGLLLLLSWNSARTAER
jgi:hypothetical protein